MRAAPQLLEEFELLALFEQNDYLIHSKKKIEFALHAPETIMATHRRVTDVLS